MQVLQVNSRVIVLRNTREQARTMGELETKASTKPRVEQQEDGAKAPLPAPVKRTRKAKK